MPHRGLLPVKPRPRPKRSAAARTATSSEAGQSNNGEALSGYQRTNDLEIPGQPLRRYQPPIGVVAFHHPVAVLRDLPTSRRGNELARIGLPRPVLTRLSSDGYPLSLHRSPQSTVPAHQHCRARGDRVQHKRKQVFSVEAAATRQLPSDLQSIHAHSVTTRERGPQLWQGPGIGKASFPLVAHNRDRLAAQLLAERPHLAD